MMTEPEYPSLREQRIIGKQIMDDAENLYFGEEPKLPAVQAHLQHERDGLAALDCEFCPYVEETEEPEEDCV